MRELLLWRRWIRWHQAKHAILAVYKVLLNVLVENRVPCLRRIREVPHWLRRKGIWLPREGHIGERVHVLRREAHMLLEAEARREQVRVLGWHLDLYLNVLVLIHDHRWLLLVFHASLVGLGALLRSLLRRLERGLLVMGKVGRGSLEVRLREGR